MSMKKLFALALVLALSITMLAGCAQSAASTTAAPEATTAAPAATTAAETTAAASEAKTYKIGVSFDYLSDFMATCVDGVNGYAKENPNVTVTIQDAALDVSKQLQQVENFISAGYDAIVIKPVDGDGCGPMSDACKKANIPFVVINSPVNNTEYSTYVGSDHVLSGKLQGEFVAKALNGKGNIVILQGDLKNSATTMRTDGNKSIISQYPDMKVISEQTANWMRNEAMTKMENWLNSGLKIDAVLANNDEMALGAAQVLKEAKITNILVCGIDATKDALNALKDGTMAMTVFQNGYQQGYQGVASAVKILNGETVPQYVDVPYEAVLPAQADEYLKKIGG